MIKSTLCGFYAVCKPFLAPCGKRDINLYKQSQSAKNKAWDGALLARAANSEKLQDYASFMFQDAW